MLLFHFFLGTASKTYEGILSTLGLWNDGDIRLGHDGECYARLLDGSVDAHVTIRKRLEKYANAHCNLTLLERGITDVRMGLGVSRTMDPRLATDTAYKFHR